MRLFFVFSSPWYGIQSLQLSPNTVREHPGADANSSKTRNAYDRMEGSLAALLDFFQYKGVSPSAIQELRVDLLAKQKYVPLMKRLEEYAKCSLLSRKNDDDDDDSAEAAYYLLLNAWEALCEYTHMQHQHAFKCFHVGRLQKSQRQQALIFNSNYNRNSDPEQNKLSQRLSLPSLRMNSGINHSKSSSQHTTTIMQPRHSSKQHNNNLSLQPMTLVELTLLAEQSCACQKGYLLAKKSWAKKMNQENNRE
jgi:hypothetical protein